MDFANRRIKKNFRGLISLSLHTNLILSKNHLLLPEGQNAPALNCENFTSFYTQILFRSIGDDIFHRHVHPFNAIPLEVY